MDVGFTNVTVQRNCSELITSRMRSEDAVLAHGATTAAAARLADVTALLAYRYRITRSLGQVQLCECYESLQGVEVQLHSFLISEMDGCDLLVSHPC